jgi:hypothetical protein
MASKIDENLFSLVDSIDAFGDGTTLIYKGNEKVNYLESCEADTGYTEALSDLGFKYQRIEIEADDWQVAEEWGSVVSQDSLSELLESAEEVGFTVTITPPEE